jgi:hypothetical protein
MVRPFCLGRHRTRSYGGGMSNRSWIRSGIAARGLLDGRGQTLYAATLEASLLAVRVRRTALMATT